MKQPIVCLLVLCACSSRTQVAADAAPPSGSPDAQTPAEPLDALAPPSFAAAACPAQPNCENGFCLIPAGTFIMGSPEDEFARGRYNEDLTEVTLTHSFLLQQTEVTQGQWKSMGFPNRAGTKPDVSAGTDCMGDDCPAAVLGWCEAVLFANHLSRLEGRKECMTLTNPRGTVGVDFVCDGAEPHDSSYYDCDGYRLPTTGEWEYATRAGTTTTFFFGPWGETKNLICFEFSPLSRVAWYCANAGGTTHPVCTREPNPWGLFDLYGNASEAVADMGVSGYGPGPVVDPPLAVEREVGMRSLNPRLYRGANWFSDPYAMRSAAQFVADPQSRFAGEGFRLARTIK